MEEAPMSKPKKKDLEAAAALYTEENDFGRGEAHEDVSGKTVSISIRLPERQLEVLKEFARREGVGYQPLMKRWLDDRIRDEYVQLSGEKTTQEVIVKLRRNFNRAMRQLLELDKKAS